MADLPTGLVSYFDECLVGPLNALMIATDPDAHVIAWRGDSAAYGLPCLETGLDLPDALPLLIGTLEALTEPLVLEFVATPAGGVAHIHLLPLPQGFGLIFVEAGEEHDSRQARQQISHELALVNEQKTKLLTKLERAQRELEESNRQLEEAGMLKTLFMGRMSHEFRTPLASILGHVRLAEDELGDMAKHLHAIRSGGEYLLALVENLLDQARMDNDELTLQASETDLQDLVEGIKAMFSDQAAMKGLGFTVVCHNLPPLAWIDGTRLRQVMINLLGNALKFTEQGQISVELRYQEEQLTVSVADTGPGIPAEMRAKIFEPFSQVQDDRSRKGAGLGLSISRSLVALMGGALQLTVPDSRGSLFHFTIPAPVCAPTAQTAPTAATLLLVEDDEDLQALLGIYLQAGGYHLRFAANGHDAVAAVAAEAPDLVLMDMHLPGLSGPEAILAIRQQGYTGPVITLSAASESADRLAAAQAGSDAYLNKPVDHKVLLSTIEDLLKHDAA